VSLPVVHVVLDAQDGAMGEIVNLRREKKRRQRQEADCRAEAEPRASGRTAAQCGVLVAPTDRNRL